MAIQSSLVYCPPLKGKEPVLLYSKTALRDCSSVTLTKQQHNSALQFIQHWQQAKVSRYNRFRDDGHLPAVYVLLILQRKQSSKVRQAMLRQAVRLAQQADAEVLLCHDEHDAIKWPTALAAGVHFVPSSSHHASLLAHAVCVVVADSWLGFEALLWGKPVYSDKPSFYSALTRGYGDSNYTNLATKLDPNVFKWVWQLFFQQAGSVNYDNNAQPYGNVFDAIDWLSFQRSQRQRFAPRLYAIGFNYHWRNSVKAFLQGSELIFVNSAAEVPPFSNAVIWGRRDVSEKLHSSVKLLRLEDGFIRSVGLGIQFAQPLSWVADSRGLYFDASQISDLEYLLAEHSLNADLQQQAGALIRQLVCQRISKYNTGTVSWQPPNTKKKRILVPGQVESDASIAYGCGTIRTNIALLKAVRQANPEAYIIYKPHPDVLSGGRAAGVAEQDASDFCDLVLSNVSIAAVFSSVDEVHVLTSLAGFEALLRGKKVFCYGMPFYAGWGLTVDLCPIPRRQRKLTLEQLVAATLLLYPIYLSRVSGYYCYASQTLQQILQWRTEKPSLKQWLGTVVRSAINSIIGAK
jgi:capsular polysaccharide export protein